jgi:GT2 family glycosyltransferase
MNTQPVVSVCIANYNGMGLIDECIASVRAQDCNIAIEIIVHDDASSDGSVEHIQRNYPDVHLIASDENVGFCVANNRMAAVAQGELLLLLNNDAALFPDALRTLYESSIKIEKPAILGLPQYDYETGALIDRGCLLDPFLNPVPNLDPTRREVAMVIGACFWIPRVLWEELGGFPEWFGSIAEDMYLCCYARLVGYQVMVMGQSGYRHRVGASFGGGKVLINKKLSSAFVRRALSERNKTFTMAICYPFSILIWLLLIHLALIHIEGLLLTLIRGDQKIWTIIYAPLLPALWSQRKRVISLRHAVHSRRKISLRTWLAMFRCTLWKFNLLVRHGLPKLN